MPIKPGACLLLPARAFFPRRYQLTRPAIKLRVRLPPSQYSVTSIVRSICRLAPCRGWDRQAGGRRRQARKQQHQGMHQASEPAADAHAGRRHDHSRPVACCHARTPPALQRCSHQEGDDVRVPAGTQDCNLPLEVFLRLVPRGLRHSLQGADRAMHRGTSGATAQHTLCGQPQLSGPPTGHCLQQRRAPWHGQGVAASPVAAFGRHSGTHC